MRPLYCVIGKSGSGKDTIVNELCHQFGFKKVLSYTTRKPRNSNRDRISHIFSDVETYVSCKESGQIAAETDFGGNLYWATFDQLDESDFYILDPRGFFDLQKKYDRRLIPIYIHTDDEIRKERMRKRGDSDIDIISRLTQDAYEFQELDNILFDICVFNNNKPIREIIHKLKENIIYVNDVKPNETIIIQ